MISTLTAIAWRVEAQKVPVTGKIVVYEDGLFSGTEWVGIFNSLLGHAEAGGEKCPPLADPDALTHTQIELRFAVATNVGIAFLRSSEKRLGLASRRLGELLRDNSCLPRDGSKSA